MTDAPPTSTKERRKPQPKAGASGHGQREPEPEPANAGSTTQQPKPSVASGSAQQPGTDDNDHPHDDTEARPGGVRPGPQQTDAAGADLEVTRACEDIVEAYRRGQAQRGSAFMSLAAALGMQPGTDNDTAAVKAFDSYTAQMQEVDAYRKENEPGDRAREQSPGRGAEVEEERGRPRAVGKSKGKERAAGGQSRSISHRRSRGRSRSLTPSEDERPAAKRPKQDPSLFAWVTKNTDAEKALRPELQKTIELLRVYALDIKSAKANLLNSVTIPEFPDAEWTNVLQGKPVDLNHVFNGQYMLEQDDKHVEKFGPVELSYRTATPAKVVKTSGDWVIAWQRTIAATLYAFPHRGPELDGYHLHIFSLFSAIHYTRHWCILDYDRAVRKRVAAKRDLMLTDAHEFRDLHLQCIDTFGASATKGPEEGKKRGGGTRKPKDDEACRRWNRGICDITDSTCKYTHKCSICASGEHPATRCTKNTKRKN